MKKDTIILADEIISTSEKLEKHLKIIIELLSKLLESIPQKER